MKKEKEKKMIVNLRTRWDSLNNLTKILAIVILCLTVYLVYSFFSRREYVLGQIDEQSSVAFVAEKTEEPEEILSLAFPSTTENSTTSQLTPTPSATVTETPSPTPSAMVTETPSPTPSAMVTETPSPTPSPAPTVCSAPEIFEKFSPNISEIESMPLVAPNFQEFLTLHGLNQNMIQTYSPEMVVWEPALYVIELSEELYGKFCLQLLEGWQYTITLPDGRVEIVVGGDQNIRNLPVLWGFSARYVPQYLNKVFGLGGWLSLTNPQELAVREYRYGRYHQNSSLGDNENVPFFNRFGPYAVGIGNLNMDWVPPALTTVFPTNYLDASAISGGLARPNEWIRNDDNSWTWKYSEKIPGSGNYCQAYQPCWQTPYVPENSSGYIDTWYDGGVRRFTSADLNFLINFVAVDEFTYHPGD